MTVTSEEHAALALLESRIKTLLPEEYQDCYEDVQPTSMGSAGLRFGPDGKVAWNDMWASFCDLAMAGGPPHKGTLLEPAAAFEIDGQPERYRYVVAEICRGVKMVTDLPTRRSPRPGWVRVSCLNEGMAGWLLRAIVMENVAARVEGSALDVPAAPHFRLEKEIKNVVTVMAKTSHYWLGHMWPEQQEAIGQFFASAAEKTPLVEPVPSNDGNLTDDYPKVFTRLADAIERETGLRTSNRRYRGWLGVECPNIHVAIWMMRAIATANVLSRREETVLFVPVNPRQDSQGERVVDALVHTYHLAMVKGVVGSR